MVSGSRAVTQNVRTMSVEYRPRFVCCRADREKGVRECSHHPTHDSHPVRCRLRRPPAARRTTPPFFPPANRAVGAAENFTAENFGEKSFDNPKIRFLAVRHYLWNIRRTLLDYSLWLTHPPRDSFKSAAGHTLPLDPREKRKR